MSGNNPGSAKAHFDTIVRETVEEFENDKKNLRRATLAVMTVDSLVDHIFHEFPNIISGPKKISEFRNEIQKRCMEVGLIRDIADAAKHVQLGRPTSTIKNVKDTMYEGEYVEEGYVEAGYFREGEVVAILPGGTKHSVSGLLANSIAYLLGLLDGTPWHGGPSTIVE